MKDKQIILFRITNNQGLENKKEVNYDDFVKWVMEEGIHYVKNIDSNEFYGKGFVERLFNDIKEGFKSITDSGVFVSETEEDGIVSYWYDIQGEDWESMELEEKDDMEYVQMGDVECFQKLLRDLYWNVKYNNEILFHQFKIGNTDSL